MTLGMQIELKTLRLRVETWNCETDEMETVRYIDHACHDDRVWLGKHCHWAFRNGRGVVTRPEA